MVTQNYNLVLDEQTMPWGRETVPDKNQTSFNCNRLHRIEYALARIRHCPKRAMWLHLNPCFCSDQWRASLFNNSAFYSIHPRDYSHWISPLADKGLWWWGHRCGVAVLAPNWNWHRGVRGNNGKWLVTSSTVFKIATIGVYVSTKIHTSLQLCVSMFSSLQKTAVDIFIYFLKRVCFHHGTLRNFVMTLPVNDCFGGLFLAMEPIPDKGCFHRSRHICIQWKHVLCC